MRPALLQYIFVLLFPFLLQAAEYPDMFTPSYYTDTTIKKKVNALVEICQKAPFHHPLENSEGKRPDYRVPDMGKFGAGKGPTRKEQHHPAVDLHVGNRKTVVEIFAAHDGVVSTVRDAPKYRHYVAVKKVIKDDDGSILGKLVTLYGHVDLDLNEKDGLSLDGQMVKAGDLISKHLYADTRGGPHLHFEIRYYRQDDQGDEEFYGFQQKIPGSGDWPWGRWDPDTGFGYGHPHNHSLFLYE